MSEPTANPFNSRYDAWMKLNPGAERQDVTTDVKGFVMCDHTFSDRIGKSNLLKCRQCFKVKYQEFDR
jgi:hypothetical protein